MICTNFKETLQIRIFCDTIAPYLDYAIRNWNKLKVLEVGKFNINFVVWIMVYNIHVNNSNPQYNFDLEYYWANRGARNKRRESTELR